MNLPWVYMFPILNPTSHLPPHPITLVHPGAPALSTLYHASNLDWWFVTHIIIYMFQYYSPKSSHPRPLPQSPKHCSIHLSLFCCLAYRVIVTIFLNSLGAGGEGDDRGWDGWMVSPTRWTWVWVNSRSWWWTGRPSVLQIMGLQRVGHDWATELNWTDPVLVYFFLAYFTLYNRVQFHPPH